MPLQKLANDTTGSVRIGATPESAKPSTVWLSALSAALLLTGIAVPERAPAYNVCSDDDSPCTHEVMTEQGLDLYFLQAAPHPFAQENHQH